MAEEDIFFLGRAPCWRLMRVGLLSSSFLPRAEIIIDQESVLRGFFSPFPPLPLYA